MNMKKCTLAVLAAVAALTLVSCAQQETAQSEDITHTIDAAEIASSDDTQTTLGGDDTQIPNPIVSYDTLADACAAAGFEMTVPEQLEGYEAPSFQTIDTDLVQVVYESESDSLIMLRKAPGVEDISGDYTDYEWTNFMDVDGLNVMIRGEGETVYLATWTNDGYTYSASFGLGMTQTDAAGLIAAVK